MRRTLILIGAAAALVVPSAAQAHSGPSKGDHAAAVKACRAERGTTDASKAAFADKYGTNKNKRNAFGKCVSQKAKAKHAARVRHQQEQSSSTPTEAQHDAAVQACRDERGTTDASKAAFADKYGTNDNKRNAFGKCVSQKAKALAKDDDDQGDDDHGQGDDHANEHADDTHHS